MESLMFNPGLCHLPQEIFGFLEDRRSLLKCREVCQSWKQFVDDPNQPWRKTWNRKLKSTLEAKIYLKEKNSHWESLYEAWPHWKEICEYFQNSAPLPNMIIFTEGLVKAEAEVNKCRSLPYNFNSDLSSICYNPLMITLDYSFEILKLEATAMKANWLKVLLSCPKMLPEFHDVLDGRGTILHHAAILGSPGLVEMVLKLIYSKVLKLDVNALNKNGKTSLRILAGLYFRLNRERNSRGWLTGQNWTFTWTKDESYKCIKVMLDYAERLGIDVNKICGNHKKRTPFQTFCDADQVLKVSDLDLWIDQPIEFNEEAFKYMKQGNFLSLIQGIFEEKYKNGEDTTLLLKMLGNPEVTKTGKLYQTRILKSMNSLHSTKGKTTNRFLRPLVTKLFQERRKVYHKSQIGNEPTEKKMKRMKNSDNENETPKKKMKLQKGK